MRPQAADLEEALKKKGGLTLTQLANYDDLITDALVDRVYFWSTIRKLRGRYSACRGIQEAEVCKILQNHVIVNKDPAAAQDALLDLAGLKKYHAALRTEDEKEHFLRHLRKYINIYLPDCPFEVTTTNRYTIDTEEASITARKFIRKGEPIKYLTGIQVEMTEREEKELTGRTDFSIVISSRRKRPSLFLGPARFANHDCESNAQLKTTGPHGIHIAARRDIAIGDEITVTYGDDYFGDDNRECLCATCEKAERNGWDPKGPILPDDSSDEESEEDRGDARLRRSTRQKPEPSPVGKRKREDEEDEAHDSQQSAREPPWKRSKTKAQHPEPAQHESGRRKSEPQQKTRTHEIASPASGSFFGPTRDNLPRATTAEERKDPILDKIMRMLGRVADRETKTSQKSIDHIFQSTKSSSQVDAEDSEVDDDDDMAADLSQSEELMRNGRVTHRNARGRFGKKPKIVPASGTDMLRGTKDGRVSKPSKLPAIKKDRSFSALRNVVNADDSETDPYSIQPSPAPEADVSPFDTQKRQSSGLFQKALAEDSEDTNGAGSPSSAGADNSSLVSQASSATSMETFAAGNIAQGICDLLTTGPDAEEDNSVDTKVKVTRAQASLVRTRSSARLRDTPDSQLLSPEKDKQSQEQLRKSPRSGTTAVATAAVESIEVTTGAEESEDEGVNRGPIRKPGDYHLCESLLSGHHVRWVECRNCDGFFVQENAFLTKIGCPRCERHSKLYGYYWPKTDKEGKHDKEERVLDHRTIHRYIEPEEERMERKGGKKALAEVLREKEMSQQREESEESEVTGRKFRKSPRRSESRRMRQRMTM